MCFVTDFTQAYSHCLPLPSDCLRLSVHSRCIRVICKLSSNFMRGIWNPKCVNPHFACSVFQVVTERKIGAKHLQTVAGVGTSAYWLSTFLWDVLNYQIPLWVTIGLMYLFKVDVLTTDVRNTFSGVITLLFLFGPASAGFAYCASFSFKSASMANICMIIIGFLIGMGGM